MDVVVMIALKCRESERKGKKNAGFPKPGQMSELALLCTQMSIFAQEFPL